MNTLATNRTNMIRTTNQLCADNTSATSAIAAFAPSLAASQAKLLLIDQLDQIAITTTTGVTLDTKALRITMTGIAFKCSSAIFAYATSINNNTLKNKVNYSLSELNLLKKDEIDDVCKTIRDLANQHIANVQNYGITPTDVTDLQTAINLYRIGMQNPRQAIITRNDAIKQIKLLIKEIISILFKEQMDKMVNTLKAANPNFVNQYFSAREIIDLGTGPSPLPAFLTAVTDQSVLQGFNIGIRGFEGDEVSILWGDGTTTDITLDGTTQNTPHSYLTPGIYEIEVKGNHPERIIEALITHATLTSAQAASSLTALEVLNLEYNPLTNFILPNTLTGLNYVSFFQGALSVTSINNILQTINSFNTSPTGASILLHGGANAAPTGQGITAKNELESRGWAVATN